jgi:flagellar biosynthesis anti-sigma factor FlgM
MDIRDVHSWNVNPADQPGEARDVEHSPNASDWSDDRGTLPAPAQTLGETRRAALEVPEVRTERVEGVRSKLADGAFTVDTERIARSLLDQGIIHF